MNEVATILSLHLAGATAFVVVLFISIGLLLANKKTHYRMASIGVAGLTIMEIASGVSLSVLTNDGLISTCAKAGIYLAIAGVMEYFLLRPQPSALAATTKE